MGEQELLVTNIDSTVHVIWGIAIQISYLMGIFFLGYGVVRYMLNKSSPKFDTADDAKSPLRAVIIGTLLLNIPMAMTFAGNTFFGTGSNELMGYSELSGSDEAYRDVVIMVLHIVQLVGLFGFIKVILNIKKPESQGGGLQAMGFPLLGSVAALNIVFLLNLVANTLGGFIGDVIHRIV